MHVDCLGQKNFNGFYFGKFPWTEFEWKFQQGVE